MRERERESERERAREPIATSVQGHGLDERMPDILVRMPGIGDEFVTWWAASRPPETPELLLAS